MVNQGSDIINEWVQQYTGQLYSWAFAKTGRKEVAEDIVQDTFLAALQAQDKYEGRSSPKTWLFAILNNKIADYHRKNMHELVQGPLTPGGQESELNFESNFENRGWAPEQEPIVWKIDDKNLLDNNEFNETLKGCLKKLPATWHSVIHFVFMQNKKGPQVCQDLGISATNFWQILHRAKLQLRKCLEHNWFAK